MLIATLLTGITAHAHDFEAQNNDGVTIYYNIISSTDKTCKVTYAGDYYSSYSNEYAGSIIIPETVTYNGTTYSVTSIGYAAFRDCTGLTSITIPNSVTSIGLYAFKGTGWYNNQPDGILYLDNCFLGYKGNSATGNLTLVDGTRLIAENAFRSCTGLTSVTIPNSVTGIGDYAFSWCKGLTSITIGVKVSTIGRCAFSGDYNIQTIACKAKTPPTCGTDVFKSVKVESVQLTVPKESVSLYQTADTWLDFCNITGAEFSGIEETIVDDVEGAEYYNLQGVKVENPERGLYIKRQGGKTSKVIL